MQASSDRRGTDPAAQPPGPPPRGADPLARLPGACLGADPGEQPAEGGDHGARGMRASDAERDQAVGQLRDRFAEGRISQETFLYRMDVALRAKDRSELSDLLRDLPGAKVQWPAPRRTVRGSMTRLRQAAAGRLGALFKPPPGQAATSQLIPGQPARMPPAPGQQASEPRWRRRARAARSDPPPLCLPPHTDGRFTIGRALSCDFTLADLSVSRWHAKLHKEEDHWMLSDLGSTNGTRLNGWRVTTGVPVLPGDRVSFGAVTFVITDRPVGAA